MVNTKVTLSGWELDNPVIPASGTFGYGREFASLYPLDMLGTFSFKGTTVSPRFGNPTPRIAEWDAGIINSIGLQNPGMEHVLEHELPEMKEYFHKKVIANVSGFSVDEYVTLCERFGREEQVGILEVNVSCPNVRAGGMAHGTSCENVYAIAKAVKNVTDKPIYMKLSPNVTDISAIAAACEEGGADGVSLINTLTGMAIDLKTRRPVLANVTGGLSGPAVRPVALRMCYQAAQAVSIPVVGMGGIMTGEDAAAFLLAGCTAVQVGTANLSDPMACIRILEELEHYCSQNGIADVNELIGGLIVE